ncbi:hypothetical protein [Paracoccus sp. J55]|uniref:hypothetical protein n=1 Tax=Paracoccus sp. J55 TaxID=935849 RepID=UPI0012EB24E4|nr:hypothetical protein [Paracoccus sp. J55]
MAYIDVPITHEMLEVAKQTVDQVKVNRTVASPYDTLAGLLGEMAVAEWFYGDWRKHDLTNTKGKADILDRIEVKTSAFPFRDTLNLLVREDYAAARRPECYIQVIIDQPDRYSKSIEPGTIARISGWATSDEVDQAPRRDFGSKGGGSGGYQCHYIAIRNLRDMNTFPIEWQP